MDQATLAIYGARAAELCEEYRASHPQSLCDSIKAFFIPGGPTADIGSGSGRDTAWLNDNGYPCTGYDASAEMLQCARTFYPACQFEQDSLPNLRTIEKDSVANILCSGVLMHLRREELITAVLNIARILKPDGRLILSYRPSTSIGDREPDGRLYTTIQPGKLILLLESAGLRVAVSGTQPDAHRPDIQWNVIVAEKAPENHVRGLERIQSILVQDAKTATYKLALIRAFCLISRTQANLVQWQKGDVYVPMRAVARQWLSLYWPLLTAPTFIAQTRGEAKDADRRVAFRPAIERLAAEHGPGVLWAVVRDIEINPSKYKPALKVIANTVRTGPVTYTGTVRSPVFEFFLKLPGSLILHSQDTLGWIRVPEDIWMDICRFDHWIEDSVIMRWAELTEQMNGGLTMPQIIPYLLTTPGDQRDTQNIHDLIVGINQPLTCVWSGERLSIDLHIDHAIPFSVWRNNDYWNLLPCNPQVNLNKRDRLPAQSLIDKRADCIIEYWRLYRSQYIHRFDQQLGDSFACTPGSPSWEREAIAGFKEAVQRITFTRGLGEWQP